MQNRKNTIKKSRRWNLNFLAWLDAIEKLDILVLEIRHLQHTCIYSLREPSLHEILQPEEILLEPLHSSEDSIVGFFEKLFMYPQVSDHLLTARDVVREFVPLFPDPEGAPKKAPSGGLQERLSSIWIEGIWSDSSKDLYSVLRAAQQVKRQIWADRLTLFLEGFEKLGLHKTPSERVTVLKSLPELFLLRIAVLSRSHNYLQRIGDLQQRLAQHLESTPLQYPRPSVHRRRMQGTYTQYLADRAAYLRQSLNMLLAELRGTPDASLPCPTIFHRWEHSHTSRQDAFLDEIEEQNHANDGEPKARKNDRVEFVQTGFWMLDKPDNQPVLAHEVAHHAVRQHYNNLHPLWLASAHSDDEFAQLITRIRKAIDSFQVPHEFRPWVTEKGLISPLEIACDLLALSVKGMSYVYAFFLEAVGWGLEHSMVDEPGYLPHLNVRLELRKYFEAPRVRDLRDWYVRGRILVDWAHATGNVQTALDREFCSGLLVFLQDMNRQLDQATRYEEFQSGEFWKQLTDRLCVVAKQSNAAHIVKRWRSRRRRDGHRAPRFRQFPRGAQRIPLSTRFFLVKLLADNKFKLHNDYDEFVAYLPKKKRTPANLVTSLNWRYELTENWSALERGSPKELANDPRSLFKHTYDIPWQCAWLRATDFLSLENSPPQDPTEQLLRKARMGANLYVELNQNTSLGRRLFFAAVEMNGIASQSPCQRTRTLLREISVAKEARFDELHPDLRTKIEAWTAQSRCYLDKEVGHSKCGEFRDARLCQYRQGVMINRFLQIIRYGCDKESVTDTGILWNKIFGKSKGNALRYYFETRSIDSKNNLHSYYDRLTSYMDVSGEPGNGKSYFIESDLELSLASRASISGGTSLSRGGSEYSLLDLYMGSVDISASEFGIVTCGYYGALFLKPDIRQLCRCVMPNLSVNGKELLLPMFLRRETWISLKSIPLADSAYTARLGANPLNDVAAIYFIQLHRRFARMDFIDWLYSGKGYESLKLYENDRLYLTDGWADVVLLLSKRGQDNGMRSKDDFYEVKDRLLQHFLVRRLESIPTVEWFDCTKKKTSSVFVSVRIDDVSPARRNADQIAASCKKAAMGLEISGRPSVISIPGATDVTLVFPGDPDRFGWVKFLRDNVGDHDIDRLTLQIAREEQ